MTIRLRGWALSSVIAMLVAVASTAQGPPPPPTGSAIVRGRVVAADSGKPLRRARVSFMSLDFGGGPRSATTNADGRYEMKDLAAGRYNISVDRSGYLALRYGQRVPLEATRPLQIADAQTVEKVDFALPRAGQISGQVVDEVGDPVAGALVFAFRSQFWQGRRQLVPSGPLASTDDTGHYRVGGLAPGTYFVRAMTRDTWPVTRAGRKEIMTFAPTYFPATPDVNAAERVSVGIGQQVHGIDFAMVPSRAVTVSGTAVGAHNQPLTNVSLIQTVTGPNGGLSGFGGRATMAADGTFTIANVAPGDFTLVGVGNGEIARLPIVVGVDDVTNVSLVAAPGWSVTGTVTTDTGTPPPIRTERVRVAANLLSALIGTRVQGEPDYKQTLNSDWTFSISGITGPMRFRLSLPDGWIAKSILHNGRDLIDSIIEPARDDAPMSGVEIVVSDRVTTVSGQLVDRQGHPLDGTIVVFARDSAKWTDESRFVRATKPDQSGQYQIKGLPPGDYLAVAVEYVQDGGWNDPEYLQSIQRDAERFTITEGESRTIAPRLTAR